MNPRYHNIEEPGTTHYRVKTRLPTPEEEKLLRAWAEEADRRAQERLKKLYGER